MIPKSWSDCRIAITATIEADIIDTHRHRRTSSSPRMLKRMIR